MFKNLTYTVRKWINYGRFIDAVFCGFEAFCNRLDELDQKNQSAKKD